MKSETEQMRIIKTAYQCPLCGQTHYKKEDVMSTREEYYNYKNSVDAGYGGLTSVITDYVEELEQDRKELLGAIMGYRSGLISDKVFDELIAKHRRV